jgi:hypothetical protein
MRRATIVLAALAAALVPAGCGGGEDPDAPPHGSGPLVWTAKPLVYTPETLPGDRILTGTLRNTGLRRLRVDLPDLRIRDARGEPVQAQPIFLATFGKSLWSPTRAPAQLPETELRRTGRLAWLAPGETVPFTMAWHAPAEPARIEYDGGWVPIH